MNSNGIMASRDEITKAKRARGTIKGQLTRAYNWLRMFDIQSHTMEAVEVRLETIENM